MPLFFVFKVMQAASSPPVEHYHFFLTSLLETVRLNICECVLAAYQALTVQAAMKILMFTTLEETVNFFGDYYPDLEVSASSTEPIDLRKQAAAVHKSDEVPSMKLINQTLSYATELERIV